MWLEKKGIPTATVVTVPFHEPARLTAMAMGVPGLPLIVVVFVDESLALIEMKQRDIGYANVGVDFGASDFPAVARAFDMHGVWSDDRDGLECALGEALERQGSTLIACRIGARAYDGRF